MSIPTPERIRGGVIYGLFASSDDSRTIRYIGKTIQKPGRRLGAHRHNARAGHGTPVAKWMRRHDLEVEMVVLSTYDDYESLCKAEQAAIVSHKTLTTSGGLNCTGGGDGSVGWVHGPEVIEKIRKKAIGRKQSPEAIERSRLARRGLIVSAETRAKQSAARLGRKPAPAHLAALREARKKIRGSGNPLATLDENQVSAIKSRLWAGERQVDIARDYSVTKSAIASISQDRTWEHVPWPNDRPRVIRTRSESHAFLSDDQVRAIRALRAEGLSYSKIAERLQVGASQAHRVATGKRYAHVA